MDEFDNHDLVKIIDLANEAIIGVNYDNRIILWNKAAEKLFLYSNEEANGSNLKTLIGLIEPEVRADENMNKMQDFAKPLYGRSRQVKVRNRYGTEFSVYCDIKLHRSYYFFITSLSDAALLRYALEHSGYFVFHQDKNGRYTDTSESMDKIFDLPKREFIGKTNWQIFDDNLFSEKFETSGKDIIRTGATINDEFVINMKGKIRIVYITRLLEKNDEGDVIGLCGFGQDITRLRQNQERLQQLESERLIHDAELAIQSSKMKSEFLASMSHEIRTPINGILGLNNLLQESKLTDEQREYVEGINQSCSSLMSIINDILDFSKIEAGKIRIEIFQVDLRELLSELHALFLPMAKTKKLKFLIENKIQGDENFIMTDGGRFRQILTNILSNAFKFTFTGSIRITCEISDSKDNDDPKSIKLRIHVGFLYLKIF